MRSDSPHQCTVATAAMKTSSSGRRAVLVAVLAGLTLGAPLALCVMVLERHQDDPGLDRSPANATTPFAGNGRLWNASHLRRSEERVDTAVDPPQTDFRRPGSASRRRHPRKLGKDRSTGNELTAPTKTPAPQPPWTNGAFWTERAEALVPEGFGEADDSLFRGLLNASRVLRLEDGCGRMQNRLLALAGGGRACARYRLNADQIQGEAFSFYLGRLLGLRNLPPAALALPDPRSERWSAAAASMSGAGWSDLRPAVLTRFVPGLLPAQVPRPFRRSKGSRRLRPTHEDVGRLTPNEVSELVQWSDLVVFDYLTANLDRVVNNLFNERWDARMMTGARPVHNLYRTGAGLLVFLDNESGLLHGYRLLGRYQPLHRALLDTLCVFRTSTVRALSDLRERGVAAALREALEARDPGMREWMPFLPERNVRTLESRMDDVLDRVRTCRETYPET